MARHESQDIDARANRIFRNTLPDDWVEREQRPDYRVDYIVEIFENDESSGLWFAVQLKGTKQPRQARKRPVINYSLETEHLAYFCDRVPLPVFLIVVGVNSSKGWWVFLQQYATRELANTVWRDQKTITISLPRSQRLTNPDEFKAAVRAAYDFMAARNPVALQTAIGAMRARIRTLDPRFDLKVTASESNTDYTIFAREDISLSFSITGTKEIIRKKIGLVGRICGCNLERVVLWAWVF